MIKMGNGQVAFDALELVELYVHKASNTARLKFRYFNSETGEGYGQVRFSSINLPFSEETSDLWVRFVHSVEAQAASALFGTTTQAPTAEEGEPSFESLKVGLGGSI